MLGRVGGMSGRMGEGGRSAWRFATHRYTTSRAGPVLRDARERLRNLAGVQYGVDRGKGRTKGGTAENDFARD